MSRARMSELGWAVWTVLVCGHFALAYSWRARQFLNVDAYAHGTERLPYQGRPAMGWLYRVTEQTGAFRALAGSAPGPLRGEPAALAGLIVAFVCLAGTVLAVRAAIREATGRPVFARWPGLVVPVAMAYLLFVATYGLDCRLPYDLPSLLLFAVGVWLVVSGRVWWLYPILVIGALTRETIVFVVVFYAVHAVASGVRRRTTAAHAAALVAVWGAVRAVVGVVYAANPVEAGGGPGGLLFKLPYNLAELVNPAQWPLFASVFAFTIPLIVTGRRDIAGRGVRAAVPVTLSVFGTAMLVVGVVTEIRIFGEMIPVAALGVAAVVSTRLWNPDDDDRGDDRARVRGDRYGHGKALC